MCDNNELNGTEENAIIDEAGLQCDDCGETGCRLTPTDPTLPDEPSVIEQNESTDEEISELIKDGAALKEEAVKFINVGKLIELQAIQKFIDINTENKLGEKANIDAEWVLKYLQSKIKSYNGYKFISISIRSRKSWDSDEDFENLKDIALVKVHKHTPNQVDGEYVGELGDRIINAFKIIDDGFTGLLMDRKLNLYSGDIASGTGTENKYIGPRKNG